VSIIIIMIYLTGFLATFGITLPRAYASFRSEPSKKPVNDLIWATGPAIFLGAFWPVVLVYHVVIKLLAGMVPQYRKDEKSYQDQLRNEALRTQQDRAERELEEAQAALDEVLSPKSKPKVLVAEEGYNPGGPVLKTTSALEVAVRKREFLVHRAWLMNPGRHHADACGCSLKHDIKCRCRACFKAWNAADGK